MSREQKKLISSLKKIGITSGYALGKACKIHNKTASRFLTQSGKSSRSTIVIIENFIKTQHL